MTPHLPENVYVWASKDTQSVFTQALFKNSKALTEISIDSEDKQSTWL